MRVLVASTLGAGHFTPLLPVMAACRRAGDEVLVVGPPVLADAVSRAGYGFREGEAPPPDELGVLWERVGTVPPEEASRIVIPQIFAGANVRAMLPTLEATVRSWRPDLVLRDTAEFASAVAADAAGVPHARVGVSLASVEASALALAAPALEPRSPGLAARIAASPYLTAFPASLEDPGPPPPNVRRFRDAGEEDRVGALSDPWPEDGRPLVYMTFGSVVGRLPIAPAVFAAAMAAAADVPARVLLTVGRDVDVAALGTPAPNVRVRDWVPQAEALAHADAAVCHGGSGSTLGALAAGVPLVVVPLFADQPHNARRVAAIGAGLAVEDDPARRDGGRRRMPEPARLASAVTRLLADPAYRRRAREVAAEMRGLPSADAALGGLREAVAR